MREKGKNRVQSMGGLSQSPLKLKARGAFSTIFAVDPRKAWGTMANVVFHSLLTPAVSTRSRQTIYMQDGRGKAQFLIN